MPRVKKAAVKEKLLNVEKSVSVKNNLSENDGEGKVTESIVEMKALSLKSQVKQKGQIMTKKDDIGDEPSNKMSKTATTRASKRINKKAVSTLHNGEVEDNSGLASLTVETGDAMKPKPTKRKGRPLNKILDNGESLKEGNDAIATVMPKTNKKEMKRKITTKVEPDDNLNSIEKNADHVEKDSHQNIIQDESKKAKISKATNQKATISTKKTKNALETLSKNLENDEEKTKINNLKDVVVHLDKLPNLKRSNRKRQNETTSDNTRDDDGINHNENLLSPMKKAKTSKVIEGINLKKNVTKRVNNKNRKEKMVVQEILENDEIKAERKLKNNRKKAVTNDGKIINETLNNAVASIEEKFEEGKMGIKGKATIRTRTQKRNNAATLNLNEGIENQIEYQEEKNAVQGIEEVEESEMETVMKKGEKYPKLTNKIKRKSNAKSTKQPLNKTATIYNKADFELKLSHDNFDGYGSQPKYNLKISSWNVAGLRSWIAKGGLKYLEYEEPDIFCIQETKCATDQLPPEVSRIAGYHPYWLCMPGGYAGVAIYSKIMPINVEYGIGNTEFDTVGRLITAEYEKFFLVNVYVPNSGRKLVNLNARMEWEELFQKFIQKLDKRKPVIICGDMNVSHQEIDLANPKNNTRNAGFTKEERDRMSELLALGFVDTFRYLYPERTNSYTYWTYMSNARSRNIGWRLDYFIVSKRLIKCIIENCMRTQCLGSDHCPITLFLKL